MKLKMRLLMMFGIALAALPLTAETEKVGDYTWTYRINGDTAEIYGRYISYSYTPTPCVSPLPTGEVSIPETLGGKPVAIIGYDAFCGCSGLTSVTMSDRVTDIRDAFRGCIALSSVKIGAGVTNVYANTFYGCNESLFDTVTIPGAKIVDGWVVGNTGSLSGELNLVGIRGIGNCAFENCRNLGSVIMPEGVKCIGAGAFSGCSGLEHVAIPNSVNSIGEWAFRYCSNLLAIAVGASNADYKSVNGLLLTKDGATLIAGVNGDIAIPETVRSIEDFAFFGRTGLVSAAMSSCRGLTNIGMEAFWGCSGLTSIVIPDSVERIGGDAFSGCDDLFDTNSIPGALLIDGWAVGYNDAEFKTVTDSYGWKYRELNLSSVRGIADSAFVNCPQLCIRQYDSYVNVVLGTSIRRIGASAFYNNGSPYDYNCNFVDFNLSGVRIGSIGDSAFYGCTVRVDDNFNNIGVIEEGAFRGCFGLDDESGFIVVRGVLHEYHGGSDVVSIPESVIRIGANALSYSGSYSGAEYLPIRVPYITSVEIPDSVISIGQYAFGSQNLDNLVIGKNVSSIDESALSSLSHLSSMTVDDENPYYKVEDGALKTKEGSRIIYAFKPSFGDAVGMHGAWTTGGDAEWDAGADCARGGGVGDGQESWLEVPVNGTGVISFRWKASSESYRDEIFDYATFSVDGEEVAMIGGETDWTNVTHFIVGSGEHVVRWTYKKDEDGSDGEDCAWLGDVEYARKVCVSFSGGEEANGNPPEPLTADLGAKILLPSAGSLVRAKHNFVGWQHGTAVWPAGAEFAVGDQDVVLQAAWEAKRVASPVISVAERFSGESTLVTMTCETQGASIYYTLDGTEPTTGSSLYEGPFAIAETVTINAFAVRDDWFDSETASVRSIRIPDTLSESLSSSGLSFRTGGDSEWAICLDEVQDGEASARSGDISDGQTSWIETEVTGAGTVSFWWKVSSEASKKKIYDRLRFTVDAEPIPSVPDIGGETVWTNVICTIATSGNHILRWTYEKDEENDMGEDCVWLDNVVWTPADPLPALDSAATDNDAKAIVAGLSDVRLSDKIDGTASYIAFRSWVDSKGLSHDLVKDAPNAWLSYALDSPTLMAKAAPLAREDVVIESIEPSSITAEAFDFIVNIADVEIGEGARLADALGVEGAAELNESVFSSEGLSVTLERTTDGKAKATVVPDGKTPSFFLRVRGK